MGESRMALPDACARKRAKLNTNDCIQWRDAVNVVQPSVVPSVVICPNFLGNARLARNAYGAWPVRQMTALNMWQCTTSALSPALLGPASPRRNRCHTSVARQARVVRGPSRDLTSDRDRQGRLWRGDVHGGSGQ